MHKSFKEEVLYIIDLYQLSFISYHIFCWYNFVTNWFFVSKYQLQHFSPWSSM